MTNVVHAFHLSHPKLGEWWVFSDGKRSLAGSLGQTLEAVRTRWTKAHGRPDRLELKLGYHSPREAAKELAAIVFREASAAGAGDEEKAPGAVR